MSFLYSFRVFEIGSFIFYVSFTFVAVVLFQYLKFHIAYNGYIKLEDKTTVDGLDINWKKTFYVNIIARLIQISAFIYFKEKFLIL